MATAPAEAFDGHNASDGNDNAVDHEAEARKLGWKPLEEFKGDPSQHIDAEKYLQRGREIMPLLRAENDRLKERLKAVEKNSARAAEFFSKAEERAYARALADLKADAAAAAKAGDTAAMDRVMDEVAKLEKPGAAEPAIDVDARMEEFADWSKQNRWYGDNDVMRMYADREAEKLAKSKGGAFLDKADLDELAQKVRTKFEDAYPEAFGQAQRQKPRSAVDGGGSAPRGRGGRTFADLPPEAQAMCRKWVNAGIIKSEADYVKSYQWEKK